MTTASMISRELEYDHYIRLHRSTIIDGDATALYLENKALQRKNHELKRELTKLRSRRTC